MSAMINLQTSLVLTCVLALVSCKKGQTTAPRPPNAQSASAPTKAADRFAASATASQPSNDAPGIFTAAELITLIDKATRIEARSGKGQNPTWSKDLTPTEIAKLKAGIGQASGFSRSVPRCLPTVLVTLYQQDKALGTLGAFCDRGNLTGPIRFDIDQAMGSFTAEDLAKVNAALESPVDR